MSNDNIRDEINELKRMITKNVAAVDKLDARCQEFDMRIPRIEMDIGTSRSEINSKASREDLQNVQNSMKDYIGKQELEFLQDTLTSKASFQDINDLNVKIEDLNLKFKDKINYMEFNGFKEIMEKEIKLVNSIYLTKE